MHTLRIPNVPESVPGLVVVAEKLQRASAGRAPLLGAARAGAVVLDVVRHVFPSTSARNFLAISYGSSQMQSKSPLGLSVHPFKCDSQEL